MSEQTKILVPKLRFPEFQNAGGWKKYQLQEFSTIIRGASPRPQGDLRYYGGTVPRLMGKDVSRDGKWVTPCTDYLTEEGAKLSRFCKKGTLTIICSGDVGVPSFLAIDACIHDGFLALVDINKKIIDENYIYYCLVYLQKIFNDSATHGGIYVNLTTTILKEFELRIPSIKEQQKIADCLSSIDELITAQNKKIDALKDHKKGLMQQLFPLDGETVPKLRFPEFKDAGEWEEKTLSQVAKYENGKAHEQDITEFGQYVVVNSKFISTDGEVKKYTNQGNCLAKKDDILMVLSDVPNGRAIAKCFVVNADNLYTVNQRICKITPTKALSKILFYLINRSPYFLDFDDGVKQTNLKNDDVLNCPILLPVDILEQQKIADCLTSVDDLITAQIQKLETLKAHKKGLMQQLFPIIDEVGE